MEGPPRAGMAELRWVEKEVKKPAEKRIDPQTPTLTLVLNSGSLSPAQLPGLLPGPAWPHTGCLVFCHPQ